jgi:proteic killer suppression protein
VILSFGDKESEKNFNLTSSRKIAQEIQERAYHKLVAIHVAESIGNLRQPPSNHLELLKGKLAEFYSIRINKQWRIIFRWEGNDAHDLQITDSH